jgi:SPP1 gp7 family putative phage head morphogenesis protein
MSTLQARRNSDRRPEEYTLPPVMPSAAIEAKYRRVLERLITQMNDSVVHWVRAQWRKNTPELAEDERRSFPEASPWDIPKNFTGVTLARGHTVVGEGKRGWSAYYRRQLLRASNGNVRQFSSKEAAEAALQRYIEQNVPADDLSKVIKDLRRRWEEKFDTMAEKFSDYFAEDVEDRVDGALKKAMKDAGWTVKMTLTTEQKDVLKASINQSVGLIKSIPSKYFDQVESAVQRSVQYGRDLGRLSKELQKEYGVTKRRAAMIARDQNNKATAALTRTRQQQLGITEALWVHSSAGKVPRPTHVKMNGKKYDVSKGFFDSAEGRHVFPGELINCRCFSRSIIPGFS